MTFDELVECRHMVFDIEDLDERMKRMESQIERITTAMTMAGGGGKQVNDTMAEQIATLLDMRDELWDMIIAKQTKSTEMRTAFSVLPWEQRRIMELRYLDGLSWREVCEKAHYERTWCFHLHREALKKLGIETKE